MSNPYEYYDLISGEAMIIPDLKNARGFSGEIMCYSASTKWKTRIVNVIPLISPEAQKLHQFLKKNGGKLTRTESFMWGDFHTLTVSCLIKMGVVKVTNTGWWNEKNMPCEVELVNK